MKQPKQKAISSTEFEAKKKIALESAPVRKIVNTGDIKIKSDELFINDVKANFSNNGITQLAETMGIPSTFITKYAKIFGEEGRNKLINHIATGLGSKNKNIMLIGSPTTGSIIDVKSSNHKYISGASFMKLVEDTLNDNPNLILSDFYVNDRGQLRVDTLNPNKPFNFGKDEDFLAGMNFTQSPEKGTQLSQYMWREVCTNGMFGIDDVKIQIGYDDDIMRSLYENIGKIAKTDFLPVGFGERIKRASGAKASLFELNTALQHMPKEAKDIDRFIHYNHIMHNLRTRNIAHKDLNPQQQKNCRLDCSVWDVVNAMTDYASHDYGFKVSSMESHSIQKDATKMFFKKNYDTENLV